MSRTLIGYLLHPTVRYGLLLEHGCEKTHNNYFNEMLVQLGVNPHKYGWASVQLDGGIDSASHKVLTYFQSLLQNETKGKLERQ